MMKKQKLIGLFAVAAFGGILFAACNKNDDPAPVPVQIQRLTQKDWTITAISTPRAGAPAEDSSILKDCMSDDKIKFSMVAGFELQDGTTKCDSTVFPYAKGNWGYRFDSDSIQFLTSAPVANKYSSWKVLTLNDSVLKVRFIDSLNPAQKLTKTVSFKNK